MLSMGPRGPQAWLSRVISLSEKPPPALWGSGVLVPGERGSWGRVRVSCGQHVWLIKGLVTLDIPLHTSWLIRIAGWYIDDSESSILDEKAET